MDLKHLLWRAQNIRQAYNEFNWRNGKKVWQTSDYAQGLVGDVGDLIKLLLESNSTNDPKRLDQKLRHELADCLWSLAAIADELNIDLEREFTVTLEYLEQKLNESLK